MKQHLNITIKGKVQGVYFRKHAKEEAKKYELKGFIKNENKDKVLIEVEGEEFFLQKFLLWCKHGPELAKVREVRFEHGEVEHFEDFEIKH